MYTGNEILVLLCFPPQIQLYITFLEFKEACLRRVLELQEEAAHRPSDSKFSQDILLDVFAMGLVRHWKKSPREAVAPSLEEFTVRSNSAFNNLI